MSEEEKKAIEYLKVRLYGNEGCELIDVAQSDLRIIIKLVDRVLKDDKNWQEIYDEQEENIREKNNKICEFEFIIENQQKELNNLKEIEQSHKEENGKLRVELEQEKVISKYWQDRFLDQVKYGNKITISGDPETIKYVIDTVTYNYIHKDKIKEMKEFYINEHKNKDITLIPIQNIIENINILLEGK